MAKLKKGDMVTVLSGKSKGKRGEIKKIIKKTSAGKLNLYAIVDGANIIKKHTKPTQQKPGGIIEKEAPIHLSNLLPWNDAASKGGRVGFKTLEDGSKVRVFKSNGEAL